MGGFLKHLGFAIPIFLAVNGEGNDPKSPPRDRLPGKGLCSLCKKERVLNYRLGMFELACKVCIDDTLRVLAKRRLFARRRAALPERPVERVTEGELDEFTVRQAQWDKWMG